MRSLYILLAVIITIAFASCGKKNSADPADPNANFTTVPDTGGYQIKTGTVTVTSPDSTYSYDATKDYVAIYGNTTKYYIVCNNIKNELLFIQAAAKPTLSAPAALELVQLTGVPLRLGYYYINVSTINPTFGTISLTNYNTNAVAASGSFTASLNKVYNNTYTYVNANNYTVSGTFNLKLNPKQ
ncbi:hypothetical protein KXQ82_07840 [Mucilaginibacter sp. HMF5004]|uniref:hypothetical protein n=1 Tax=Mucilaginibacter rivuli TaxID=2857527 RepID=UPI001C5D7D8E|nr:hypothetical protein [Mucilaginibacter rivuli]MBW4889622.1 hypothetical protein [Mucilaginibacter rivuli]